ncbi:OTU (ovarian tumor)-like cysteine protease [Phaffia rhodozyma]|uniref:OTU (Ovarian tumor)-like cysteine protease n=1 Tax=Phaffia rhodozyma TaxID=264483 RepID=A0A0F7SRK9_PHARH|nr:OTU (ovarian tumor)-like cysteine protease [Phaffia rhodozyma]
MGKTHRASPSYNGKKQKRGMPSSRVKTRSHGSTSDFSMDVATYERELKAQLASMGLYASNTVGDGNCMFRALSDQLYGTPKEHMSLRREICDYLDANIDIFEFFVDDGRPFAEHMRAMRENGTWGGHLELTAFARLKQKWIKVVQPNLVYVVSCKDESPGGTPRRAAGPMFKDSDVIYLAFHNYEHWSSVRNLAGPHAGPPLTKEVPRPSTSFSPTRSSTSTLSSPPSRSLSPTSFSDKPSEVESLILSSIPSGSASLIKIREITRQVARKETDGQMDDVPWEQVVEVIIDQLDKNGDGDKEMMDLDRGHDPSPISAPASKTPPPLEQILSQETINQDREDRGRSVLPTLAQREGHPYPWRESSPVPSTDGSSFGEKDDRSPSVASPRVASPLVADAAAGPGGLAKPKRGRKRRSPSASVSASAVASGRVASKKALLPRKQPTRTSARIRSSLVPVGQGRSEVEGSSPAPSLAGTDVSVSSTGSSFVSGSGSSVSSANPSQGGETEGTTVVSNSAPSVKTVIAPALDNSQPVDTTLSADDPTLISARSIPVIDNSSNPSSSDTRPARPRQKRSLPSSLPGSSALSNGAELSDSTSASSHPTEDEDEEDGNDSTTSSFVPSGPKSRSKTKPSGPSGTTKAKKGPTGKGKRTERRTKVAEARAARRLAVAGESVGGEGGQQGEKTLKKRREGKEGERMMTRSRKSLGTEPGGGAASKEVGKTVVGGFKELFI